MSEAKSNLFWVPQGPILGPILFNIFINDITKINLLPEITTSTAIYADDVQLLFSGTPNNLEQLKIYAETSLKPMKEWYSENGLKWIQIKLNTFFMQHQISIGWDVSNNNDDIVRQMEDKVKNLGVIFKLTVVFLLSITSNHCAPG